jgi:hypothetical protein
MRYQSRRGTLRVLALAELWQLSVCGSFISELNFIVNLKKIGRRKNEIREDVKIAGTLCRVVTE